MGARMDTEAARGLEAARGQRIASFPPAAAQQYPRGMKEREPERPLKIVSVGDPVVESDAVA